MTTNEVLNHVPFIYAHQVGIITILFILSFVAFFVYMLLSVLGTNPWMIVLNLILSLLESLIVVTLVFGLLTVVFPLKHSVLEQVQNTETRVVSTKSYALSGASSDGFSDTEVNGNLFYVSGTTTDTTSYRFVLKGNNGNYQVKTLTDMFGKVNKNDVFINESKDNKPHLQVDTREYTNKRIASIIDLNSDYASKWKTYTFYVPEHSIIQKFSFK